MKIRGYRIELGEIETALLQNPKVREAVVVAQTDAFGDMRLVAYLVAEHEQTLMSNELRSYLKEKLPDYMVPLVFIILDVLPQTPLGKIDRKALPTPKLEELCSEIFIAPGSPVEEDLATIWASLLGLSRVGINDNFFELGGHSLLATQIISRIRKAFSIDIPLRSLFEYPTIAELGVIIEKLTPQSGDQHLQTIQTIDRNEKLPLSFSQQRLWFLDQFEEKSAIYNITSANQLTGKLNVRALKKAIQILIQRHETLRTCFHKEKGIPYQVIIPKIKFNLSIKVLKPRSEKETVKTRERLTKEEAQSPFDLSQAPLLRVNLLRFSQFSHVLLVTLHHIISDGWSMGIFWRELSVLYQTYNQGKSNPLPELTIQYADYAHWQRQWLTGDVLKNQLEYWKQQLAGAPPLLELPADHPRPAIQSYQGDSVKFVLSNELTKKLKDLSHESESTLFMTLLAAFSVLLYRYTNQEDLVIGSPIANRQRSEIESLIGLFVNTLALRISLKENPPFFKLLKAVRHISLDAYAHQDLPFEKLVEDLQPERSLSHSPLFQVMFVLQNAPKKKINISDITLTPLDINRETAKFDLTLSLTETEGELKGEFGYSKDLFKRDRIERMAGHFQTLLEEIVANPKQLITKLPILSKSERLQIVELWNHTQVEYPIGQCLHQLFEQQVERTPESIAVICNSKRLTFSQLNTKANGVANHLQKLGVARETLIGICVERSLDLVAGILGILKAGCAYVPLDPTYPKERLSYILDDAHVPILLSQKGLANRFSSSKAKIVCIDSNIIKSSKRQNLEIKVHSENLAYVIYTSGSTGRPKGVAIEHHSAVTLAYWAKDTFSSKDLSGILFSTSICFDLSVFELFVPLSWGGKVILAENALQLPNIPAANEVTLINTVPSVIRELLHISGVPKSVRTINLAGEPLKTSLVRSIYKNCNAKNVYDLYGPSEDTTYSTFAKREMNSPETIGKPIANTQIFILDSHLQLVPIGVPGELYISGNGLAREYHNQPNLTKEKFIRNPFSTDTTSRLYRSGDMAQFRADGNIEILGRLDDQVKIRGFRIELGEIEAVLAEHPNVIDTLVTATETPTDDDSTLLLSKDKRLIAYIVTKNGKGFSITDNLKNFLKKKFPKYMIPSAIVSLRAFPLTPNGKIDRNALPVPDLKNLTSTAFVAPSSQIEKELAAIWASLLGLDKVGIHHNFFELGGHSLLATQVISRLQQDFTIGIPMRSFFENPTVADLAERIETIRWVNQNNDSSLATNQEDRQKGEV